MKNSNAGERPAGAKVAQESEATLFAVYDALPRDLKELIDTAPIPVSPAEVARLWLSLNRDTALTVKTYTATIREFFPGWKPI